MRALTLDELENIYGGQGTVLSSVVVIGHQPAPDYVSDIPTPSPLPPTPAPSPPTAVPMGTTPTCNTPARLVNAPFVFGHELGPGGGIATTGYYPGGGNGQKIALNDNGTATVSTTSHSGLTIGYGVDMGQLTAAQLASRLTVQGKYYWPPGPHGSENKEYANAITKLTPYLGDRSAASIALTEQQNGGAPTISLDAASVISNGALDYQMSRASSDYMQATSTQGGFSNADFYALPSAVQTVLTDITYVFGSIYTTNPALPVGVMNATGTQNWSALSSLLTGSTNPTYGTRLRNDGEAIAASIASGATPKKGTPCTK